MPKYRQPALVEAYVAGREFTVGLLGERRPRVLPPMEIVFLDASDPTPIYSFDMKQDWNDKIRYEVPAQALAEGARPAREGGARVLHGARVPRRRPRRLPHGRGGPDLLHRVQPAAGPHAGLVGPRAHRPGRRHRVPGPHRRDPRVRDPPLPGARAGAGAAPARAGGGGARGARARRGGAAGAGHGARRRLQPGRRTARRGLPGPPARARRPYNHGDVRRRRHRTSLADARASWGPARPVQAGALERDHRRRWREGRATRPSSAGGGPAEGRQGSGPHRGHRHPPERGERIRGTGRRRRVHPQRRRRGLGDDAAPRVGAHRDADLPHQHALRRRRVGRGGEVDDRALPGHRRRARRHHPARGRVRRLLAQRHRRAPRARGARHRGAPHRERRAGGRRAASAAARG